MPIKRYQGKATDKDIPLLRTRLRSRHLEIREDAIHALGQLGVAAREACPDLRRCLTQKHQGIRFGAAWSLIQIGEAIPQAYITLLNRRLDRRGWWTPLNGGFEEWLSLMRWGTVLAKRRWEPLKALLEQGKFVSGINPPDREALRQIHSLIKKEVPALQSMLVRIELRCRLLAGEILRQIPHYASDKLALARRRSMNDEQVWLEWVVNAIKVDRKVREVITT